MRYVTAVVMGVAIMAMAGTGCAADGDARKHKKLIIGDYFPYHRSRPHDGSNGSWQQNLIAKDSKAKVTHFTYNPDLLDEDGHPDMAAPTTPIVGLQSDLDPDYQEYQILVAKVAHVDGFAIEWALSGAINADLTLRSLMKTARKYDFKIGVNWIEGSHFQWIGNYRDNVETREDKLREYHKNLQYLMTEVYGADTGLLVGDRPLVLLFGGAGERTTPKEFARVLEKPLKLPKGRGKPLFTKLIGVNKNPKYRKYAFDPWAPLVDGAFGWLQAHAPMTDAPMPEELKDKFDYYMDKDHMIVYQNEFRKTVNKYYDKGAFSYRVQSAVPGFDNRGCAGWGRTLCYLDRDKGEVYRRQWAHHVKYRDQIDAVLLVTWNDCTEGTIVEPSREYGYRELAVTEKYGAAFKGIKSDPAGLPLPERLFKLRKRREFLGRTGFDVAKTVATMDKVGQLIAKGEYPRASTALDKLEAQFAKLDKSVQAVKVAVAPKIETLGEADAGDGIYTIAKAGAVMLTVDEKAAADLRKYNFDGFLTFEYLDEGRRRLRVLQDCPRKDVRAPGGVARRWSEACNIVKTDTGEWVSAKVRLYKVNCALTHKLFRKYDFAFSSPDAKVRNISLEFTAYRKK